MQYIQVNNYGIMNVKKHNMKLYSNMKQNLGMCRGPLHNLGQQLSTTNYAQK